MFECIHRIAEERIKEAQDKGEFEDLEGMGRPLPPEDLSHIPEDMRMAFRVLRNAGYLPPEVQERKDLQNMLDLIEHLDDEGERYRQIRKLNVMVRNMNARARRDVRFDLDEGYYQKIVERVHVARKGKEKG